MHACAVADELSMRRVLVPLLGGMLSAYGLAGSQPRADAVQSVIGSDRLPDRLEAVFQALEHELARRLPDAVFVRLADARYRGQSHQLTVQADPIDELAEHFADAHLRRYGYAIDDAPIEIVNARITARSARAPDPMPHGLAEEARPVDERQAWFDGVRQSVAVWRGGLTTTPADGPLIVELPGSTCIVPPGWRVATISTGALQLERRP
jgi:N-methylhydantoinase A